MSTQRTESEIMLLQKKMQEDWDARARENAFHYISSAKEDWTLENFLETGRQTISEEVLSDMGNICQGKPPSEVTVLEIGCGAGRLTRALAGIFKEVHAVDVSSEMISRAREILSNTANAHVYQNNGYDLSVLPNIEFDFAFSYLVFQHISSAAVIENYVTEVGRLLRPGGLFKFQLQGNPETGAEAGDTWLGQPYSVEHATEMAKRSGFNLRYHRGASSQYFWLWFFKTSNESL